MIKIFEKAQYGRWNLNSCRGNEMIRETCRGRYLDLLDEIAPACDGKQTCVVSETEFSFRQLVLTRTEEPCPGLPKYTS